MTPTDFARITHSLALLALSEGHDASVLLKSACAGIVLAADPTDRVTRLDVRLTSTASLKEIEVAVGFDVKQREEIRGPSSG